MRTEKSANADGLVTNASGCHTVDRVRLTKRVFLGTLGVQFTRRPISCFTHAYCFANQYRYFPIPVGQKRNASTPENLHYFPPFAHERHHRSKHHQSIGGGRGAAAGQKNTHHPRILRNTSTTIGMPSLTPEEIIEAASSKEQEKALRKKRYLVSMMANETVGSSTKEDEEEASAGGGVEKQDEFDDDDDDETRSPASSETSSGTRRTTLSRNGTTNLSLVPPRLLRNTDFHHHVQPGAYRVHRQRIVAVLGSNSSNSRTNNNHNGSGGAEAPDVIGAADSSERTRSLGDYHPHGTSTDTTGDSSDDEADVDAGVTSSSSFHQPDEEDAVVQQDVMLEAELVDLDSPVFKAEPVRNNNHRFTMWLLLVFIAILTLALSGSLLAPKLQRLRRRRKKNVVFPYYTHHEVLFASTGASLVNLDVVLQCGNGAVVVKSTDGPCDERNGGGAVTCNLGNTLGDYDRPIFFSCGSHQLIDSPTASASASASRGTGRISLCLFQLCHEELVTQNTTCSDNAVLNQVQANDDDGGQQPEQQQLFSLCFSHDILAGVSVTNVGVTCSAETPFDQSETQINSAQHKQDSIMAWLAQDDHDNVVNATTTVAAVATVAPSTNNNNSSSHNALSTP
jgi:hypothetical protein